MNSIQSSQRSIVPQSGLTRTKKPLTDEQKKKQYEKDHTIVSGVFRCYEPIGGNVEFFFKKYKQDKPIKYTLFDGDIIDLPYMVADHLNTNCQYTRHKHAMDVNGNPVVDRHSIKKKRYSFDSMQYQIQKGSMDK